MLKFQYTTTDIHTISVHDMIITKIKLQNDNICFYFDEGFAVTKLNEQNKTLKHMQTGKSVISLQKGKYLGGENLSKTDTITDDLLTNQEFEVLEFQIEKQLLQIFCNDELHNFCILKFSFETLQCGWNSFTGTAWFEGWAQ